MNNIVAYSVYLVIVVFITVIVGRDLHKNGLHLIVDLFQNEAFARTVNNLLLTGYYLVNVGYATLAIAKFGVVGTTEQFILELGDKVGVILVILGVLHFNNIILLHLLSKRKQQIIQIFNN